MSDIQLFRLSDGTASELSSQTAKLEKQLQGLIEANMPTVTLEEGFSRDVSQIGHWATGDLELTLRMSADLERAKPLMERSYVEG